MKKIYVFLFSLIVAFSLVACSKENAENEKDDSAIENVVDTEESNTNKNNTNKDSKDKEDTAKEDVDVKKDNVNDDNTDKKDTTSTDDTNKEDKNSNLKYTETTLDKNRFETEDDYILYSELGFGNMVFALVEDVAYSVFLNPSADTQNTDVLVYEADTYLVYEDTMASCTTFRFHLKDAEKAVNVTYAYGTKRFNEAEKTEMVEAFRNSIINNLDSMQ